MPAGKKVEQKTQRHPRLQELLDAGIPLSEVTFQNPVHSLATGEPEHRFYAIREGVIQKPSRKANLWLVAGGMIIVEQSGRTKVIAASNMRESEPL